MAAIHSPSSVEYVFEPHSSTMPPLRDYLSALWDRRAFLVEIAKADLRTARAQTMLGRIWGVLDALFMAGIYFFLYTVIRGRAGGDQLEFLPVLITGIFLFTLSMGALGEGGASIKRSKMLMLNSTFPRALLPIAAVYKGLLKFIPAAFVLALVLLLLRAEIGVGIFLMPLLFVLQTVANVGLAMLVATFVTLNPDGTNVMSYVQRILFFVTPIIYPVTLLPDAARAILTFQPLFPFFASYQAIVSGGVPSLGMLAMSVFWAVTLLIVGGRLFLRHERQFALHL
jgi:teichoic acid transport system permease protein